MKIQKDSIKIDHNYDKNKSFLNFQRDKVRDDQTQIKALIKKALVDKKLISKIDQEHIHIIQALENDLFNNKKEENKIKFEISPNEEKEIELLEYKDLLDSILKTGQLEGDMMYGFRLSLAYDYMQSHLESFLEEMKLFKTFLKEISEKDKV